MIVFLFIGFRELHVYVDITGLHEDSVSDNATFKSYSNGILVMVHVLRK